VKVAAVQQASPAAKAGIRPGDEILALNGSPVADSLDYLYASSELSLHLRLRRPGGAIEEVFLSRQVGTALGITLAPDPVRRCSNRCVFCFIDQNPKGLRDSIYVKDEDYRLSLLYGNYLTLTNLRPAEIARIRRQRISPLYVSVHATEPRVRRRLLGCRRSGAILPLLTDLAASGIEIHAQIVVVPGYNDGNVLDRTLADLEGLHPALRSVAIVPVGLTRHRRGLAPLRGMTRAGARRALASVAARQESCLAAFGTRLHFAADELFLLAGLELPPYSAYEDFAQTENGVGMVRRFERRLGRLGRLFPSLPRETGRARRRRIALASGSRFAGILARWLPGALARTREEAAVSAEVLAVRNRFFGARVTASGLLVGRDLVAALTGALPFDLAVVPPEVFNHEGLTLDGMTRGDLAGAIGRPVQADLGPGSALADPARRSPAARVTRRANHS
jgi:putative radical SAM enzyme (TIGR03279 family)